MAMHIVGFESHDAIPYAVRLGVALQMTNILRDVAEDWKAERLYLPLDDLKAFNLTEADIDKGNLNEDWQAFIDFQIERTNRLYMESWSGIKMLNPEGRFAIAAAADLYRAILGDIQRHKGTFSRDGHTCLRGANCLGCQEFGYDPGNYKCHQTNNYQRIGGYKNEDWNCRNRNGWCYRCICYGYARCWA
jgi:hypothetical protein